MKKATIVSLNGSVSESLTSHRSAWALMRREQLLREKIFDEVFIGEDYLEEATDVVYYFGMEWVGTLNLFGGANKINGDRIRQPIYHAAAKKRLWVLDIDMPDLGALAKLRDGSGKPGWVDDKHPWEELSAVCKTVRSLVPRPSAYSRFVLGDSHALSLWTPSSFISRNDHQTLYGVLKKDLADLAIEKGFCGQKDVVLYFGNIDVRHHLARQKDPTKAAEHLAADYVLQASKLAAQFGCRVQLVEILPICSDQRKIPKTGWYKGTPFYGSWQTRDEIRYAFNRRMRILSHEEGLELPFKWPEWICDDNLILKDGWMEKPGSVHLAWKATIQMLADRILK